MTSLFTLVPYYWISTFQKYQFITLLSSDLGGQTHEEIMEIQSANNKPAIKSELTYQTDDPIMKGSRPTFKTAKLLKLWQVIHLNKQVKYS